jgi:hypothetical protein
MAPASIATIITGVHSIVAASWSATNHEWKGMVAQGLAACSAGEFLAGSPMANNLDRYKTGTGAAFQGTKNPGCVAS